jgi:hypothetical protein
MLLKYNAEIDEELLFCTILRDKNFLPGKESTRITASPLLPVPQYQ